MHEGTSYCYTLFQVSVFTSQYGKDSYCLREAPDQLLSDQFMPWHLGVYSPLFFLFFFKFNLLLMSMWVLLSKDFRNGPTGITARKDLWFLCLVHHSCQRVIIPFCMFSNALSRLLSSYSSNGASILNKVAVKSNVCPSSVSKCLITQSYSGSRWAMYGVT